MTTIEKFNGGALANAIDQEAILKSLNLNPRDPKTQALLLVCDRYGLDPLLKHMVLIQGTPYVTRDGYLAVAHRSGVFDGMEVLEQTSDQTHYIAKVAVFRKDMRHAFTFVGRFPKSKQMAKEYGPEMAVKVAEVQALRRAFNVTGIPAADERWDVDPADVQTAELPPPGVDAVTGEKSGDGGADPLPTVVVRRPPPGRSKQEKGERSQESASSSEPTSNDVTPGAGGADQPPGSPPTATIPAAALDYIRRLGERKGLTDVELRALAHGKALDSLTITEANELTAAVTKHEVSA